MNEVVHRITLDVTKQGTQRRIKVKKGDTGTRKLKIMLVSGSVPYEPEATSVTVYAAVGNTTVFNNCELDGNIVTVVLSNGMTSSEGIVDCELRLQSGTNVLHSPKFEIDVENTLYDNSALEATDEFDALTEAIADAQALHNGYTYTPSVDSDGNLSWSNDGGLPNPATVNIKGPKGELGDMVITDSNIPDTIARVSSIPTKISQLQNDSGFITEIPAASETVRGGVNPAIKTSGMTQSVGVDSFGKLWTEPSGKENQIWYGEYVSDDDDGSIIVTSVDGDFTLVKGNVLILNFKNASGTVYTYYAGCLNVDGTGYKAIPSDILKFESSDIYVFVYNGTSFEYVASNVSVGITIDSELSATSENAVQNKVVKAALDEKADVEHMHGIADVSGLQAALGGVGGFFSGMSVVSSETLTEDVSQYTLNFEQSYGKITLIIFPGAAVVQGWRSIEVYNENSTQILGSYTPFTNLKLTEYEGYRIDMELSIGVEGLKVFAMTSSVCNMFYPMGGSIPYTVAQYLYTTETGAPNSLQNSSGIGGFSITTPAILTSGTKIAVLGR